MFGFFKKKEVPNCLICEKPIKGDKFSQVKYRYGADSGTIGTAYLCPKCADQVDNGQDEDYGEPI